MPLPNTGITTELVATTLGASTRQVKELCLHSNINMWSKRKPVMDSRDVVPLADVGKGLGNNYGIQMPSSYNDTDTQLCTYQKPTSSSYPKRLGDFRGYEHSAVKPITLPPQPNNINKAESLTIIPMASNNSNSLSISDLFGTTDIYFGVEVLEGTTSKGWGSNNISDGVTIPFSSITFTGSTVNVRFFLTNIIKSFSIANPGHSRYPIPRATTSENKFWTGVPLITGSVSYISLTASHEPNKNRIVITITHTNPSEYGTYRIGIYRLSDNYEITRISVDISSTTTNAYVADSIFSENVIYEARIRKGTSTDLAKTTFMLLSST